MLENECFPPCVIKSAYFWKITQNSLLSLNWEEICNDLGWGTDRSQIISVKLWPCCKVHLQVSLAVLSLCLRYLIRYYYSSCMLKINSSTQISTCMQLAKPSQCHPRKFLSIYLFSFQSDDKRSIQVEGNSSLGNREYGDISTSLIYFTFIDMSTFEALRFLLYSALNLYWRPFRLLQLITI